MKKLSLLLLFMTIMLTACFEPRIDTSSDEKMKASVDKVRASLPEDKRDDFDKALQMLIFIKVDFKDLMSDAGQASTEAKMKQSIHGKTGMEVIEEAKKIKRHKALGRITILKDKQLRAEAAKKGFADFKVVSSKFYKEKREFGRDQPIIELKVQNNTEHPVSRAYFKGTIASPGRSVPWHKDDFNYSISGGLEPGEDAHWYLAPNMFSDWGKVEAPKDAVMSVEVVRMDGADGEALYYADFTDEEAKELEELLEQYPDEKDRQPPQ